MARTAGEGGQAFADGSCREDRTRDDRREALLALTPKGERVLARLALYHHEELRSAAPSLVAALRKVMRGEKASARVRPPEL